jgi:DNA-binding NtrC family response regulator
VVAATNQEIQRRVQAGQFRSDLYYRLAQPQVQVPPLRCRPEEIPALIELVAPSLLRANFPSFRGGHLLERCLLRSWPGNVRELLAVVQDISRQVSAAGEVASLDDLLTPPTEPAVPAEEEDGQVALLDRAQVEAALRTCRGNVSEAAKSLSIHRSKLRRFLQREKITADVGLALVPTKIEGREDRASDVDAASAAGGARAPRG